MSNTKSDKNFLYVHRLIGASLGESGLFRWGFPDVDVLEILDSILQVWSLTQIILSSFFFVKTLILTSTRTSIVKQKGIKDDL